MANIETLIRLLSEIPENQQSTVEAILTLRTLEEAEKLLVELIRNTTERVNSAFSYPGDW